MQNNTPRCPYCGKSMRSVSASSYYFACKPCRSTSPVKYSFEEAYQAAICRAPMSDFELIEAIKRNPRAELKLEAPLTIEEAREYLREHGGPVWVQTKERHVGYWVLAVDATRMLGVSEESYGKSYQFWKNPPTDAELEQATRARRTRLFAALAEEAT